MKIGMSVKMSEDVVSFLKKFRTNRRKTDVDESDLSYSRLLEVIVKYFKQDEKKYLEIVKLVEGKNV